MIAIFDCKSILQDSNLMCQFVEETLSCIYYGSRFKQHGSPDLLLDPRPPLVRIIDPDPYSDPSNPPPPDTDAAFCAMKWSNETSDSTGQFQHCLWLEAMHYTGLSIWSDSWLG